MADFCIAALILWLAMANVDAFPVYAEKKPLELPQVKKHTMLRGHTRAVHSVAISGDGKTLASGSVDGTIKFWDLQTAKVTMTCPAHAIAVQSVAFSKDGKTLVSGGYDGTVKVWDVPTGKVRFSLKAHTTLVRCVAISPSGKTVACGGGTQTEDGGWYSELTMWELSTKREIWSLDAHPRSSTDCLTFSPDGKTLASGGSDRVVRLSEVTTGKKTRQFEHASFVQSIDFSPDGKLLASGSGMPLNLGASELKLWDVASGKETANFQGHTESVNGLRFAKNGKTLVSGSEDNTVRLWNVSSGMEKASLNGDFRWVMCVAFAPDGKTIAAGCGNGRIQLWSVPDND